MKRNLPFFALLLAAIGPMNAEEHRECCPTQEERCCPERGPVTFDPCYSVDMLDRLNGRPYKHLNILKRWCDGASYKSVVLSAQLRASLFYARTNEAGKFAYLGRFPGKFRGDDASVADINDFTVALTYSPLSWLHGYWEFLHSDQITFAGDPRQGTNHTQKVYAIIGDLREFPLYLTIGKRDVGFGSIYTVNPFSPSMTWHYFGALHDGISLGFEQHGLSLEVTALNGGRGIRVADTNETGKIDNFAANGRFTYCDEGWSIAVGGGYLYSTIYDGKPPEHVGPVAVGPRNGAWNVNARVRYEELQAYVEFTSTERQWESTSHLVQAFSAGACLDLEDPWLHKPVKISIEHGQGIQGKSSDEFDKNLQTVFGIDYRYCENARLSFEYIRTEGFAPLIDIAEPGVSSSSAHSDVFQLGATLNI